MGSSNHKHPRLEAQCSSQRTWPSWNVKLPEILQLRKKNGLKSRTLCTLGGSALRMASNSVSQKNGLGSGLAECSDHRLHQVMVGWSKSWTEEQRLCLGNLVVQNTYNTVQQELHPRGELQVSAYSGYIQTTPWTTLDELIPRWRCLSDPPSL